MKYIKEDLEKLIHIEKKSYREIGRMYNVSDTYIKKVCNNIGIPLPIRSIFPPNFVPANKGTRKISYCLNCGSECDYYSKKFCSMKCSGEYKTKKSYEYYLNNQEEFCNASYSPRNFKNFFLIDQNNKCSICSCENTWNNKPIIFVLDHIDGDASNNRRKNLRLICPNCDSQLDTFKSKNKHSARIKRYKPAPVPNLEMSQKYHTFGI